MTCFQSLHDFCNFKADSETPCSRASLSRELQRTLSQKISCHLWNRNISYFGNRSPSPDPTLSQANLLQNLIDYEFKVQFIVILKCTGRLTKNSLTFRFSYKFVYTFLIFPCPAYIILFYLIHLRISLFF
jgi:hypothetical protein